jgi:glycosyltransferase involved in cell wall biosynthesis
VLLESNLALTLHFHTLETRLAFRSRVLDYIWAGLPVVASGGDATSDLIKRFALGIVVGDQDVSAVAEAIDVLLAEPPAARQPQFDQARRELTWERAAAPLVAYCRHPWSAADKRTVTPSPNVFTPDRALEDLRQERDRWRALAQAYERGRFMRLMKWLKKSFP